MATGERKDPLRVSQFKCGNRRDYPGRLSRVCQVSIRLRTRSNTGKATIP